MRFPPQFIEELKARLPVSEVVGRRVKLTRAGREFKGLSPFNKEKTPSFFVNDQKQAWFDFSSGQNGSIFDFVMRTDGVTFPEAVERLAQMAGMLVPKGSREEEERDRKRKSLHEVMELAANFFEAQLSSQKGKVAAEYAKRRGLKPETIKEFRMGYALQDRFALKEYLGSKGVSVDDMIETGLLISGTDIPVPYDRFRDRLMIPIHDERGRIIAFGGRALSAEVPAKYLNSPETSLFHKGSIVFNFHRARQSAHQDGTVVVVEGYMDAIAIYQAGMRNVVASMGTAFTEDQIATLWRLSDEPIICFDADRAGVAAAYRAVERIMPVLKVGKTFQFAMLQGEKDPDDFIRENGLDAFKNILSGALPLWSLFWEKEVDISQLGTPDAQAALEARLKNLIGVIKDEAVRAAYSRTVRVELASLFWDIAKKHKAGDAAERIKGAKGFVHREVKAGSVRLKGPDYHSLQKVLLGMLVHFPQFLEEKSAKIDRIHFADQLEIFYAALYRLLVINESVSVQLIYSELGERFYRVLEDIHGRQENGKLYGHKLLERFPILKFDPDLAFVSECIDNFSRHLFAKQIADDIEELKKIAVTDETGEVAERMVDLVKAHQKEWEEILSADLALAEQASLIRKMGKPAEYFLPTAA